MHPKKAEALRSFDEMSRTLDATLQLGRKVATTRSLWFGWAGSFAAATVMLSLAGVGAVIVDANLVMLARSDDQMWERAYPSPDEPAGDSSGAA